MNLRVVIRPEAEADLASAQEWYSEQRPGLGDAFLLCVEEAFDRILRFPRLYAIVYKRVRVVVLRRFPYLICYRITRATVEILAVPHARQRPARWKRRI